MTRSEQHHDFSKYLLEKYYRPPDDPERAAKLWYPRNFFEHLMMRISKKIEIICSRIPDSDRETYLRQKYEDENIFGQVFFRSRILFSLNHEEEIHKEDMYDEFKDYILSEGWEIGPKRAEK